MARKNRSDATLGSILKKNKIKPEALKTASGRRVRSDIKVGTLRKRSKDLT
jgi:hypothetical protein